MAVVNIVTASSFVPSFWTSLGRSVGGGPNETWPTIRDGVGTYGSTNRSGGVYISTGTEAGKFAISGNIGIGFDLRDYNVLDITAARLLWGCKNSITSTLLFANDNLNGIALIGQRESIRGVNASTQDYQEVHQNGVGLVEYAYRNGWSSLPGAGGGLASWTFNAAGLAYLNGVTTKTYNPGYAYFGMVWGGVVDAATPTSDGVNRVQRVDPQVVNNNMTLELTYSSTSPAVGVNISDTWRTVAGMKVQVSGSWKTVTVPQINIADTWRDI